MDPNATFLEWVHAKSLRRAREWADFYNAWVRRGGFPAVFDGQPVRCLTPSTAEIGDRIWTSAECRRLIRTPTR